MKLGVSYNVWDSEELLESSIKTIRANVDYISVVYQIKSNFGEINHNVEKVVKDLLNRKLVNDISLYTPKDVPAQQNEVNKRNAGLAFSYISGCTHHMSMDADEFYTDQLKTVKKIIEEDDVDSCSCYMQTYYKSKYIVLYPPEQYCVPLISKIDSNSRFELNAKFYCVADPTRRIKSQGNYIIFDRDQIEMHHMSYVRDNIRRKLENSSAVSNFKDSIDNLVKYYNEWYYPQPAKIAGDTDRYYRVKKIKPVI